MHESSDAIRDTPEVSWRVLALLNLFRLAAPVVFMMVFVLAGQPRVVGGAHEDLFRVACIGYFVAGIALIFVLKRRERTTHWHAYLPGIFDILVLNLIIYASGGAESGLGIVLLLPVVAVSVLVGTRGALTVAAGAVLALLLQQIASWLDADASPVGFAQAGYYGAVVFIVAAGGAFMAHQLRETRAAVRQRDIDVANLAELSEYIVQHLRESLVVIDASDRIRLINESARQILGPEARPGALLGEISPRLLYHVGAWRRVAGANVSTASFIAADGSREIEASFAALGPDHPGPLIAFLADTSQLAEQVQRMKLAALGRLSASIAHEIRNPVGAMSHAAQLLAETSELGTQEKRLTEIITTNGERVSRIISNVLQLSRRETTRPERFFIGAWAREFLVEFCETLQLDAGQIRAVLPDPDLEVRVDPSHLRQIVWNLCENAVRHSTEVSTPKPVDLLIGRLAASGRPFLEVADRGPGIPDGAVERIFEPFFTGRRGGTGLGLFIARELAQCNGALLLYEPRVGQGSIFRVVFSDPQRWEGRADA
jgi:two-component system sensor histidine kinase PilS (NtrC family)